jgi:hypothetical protein
VGGASAPPFSLGGFMVDLYYWTFFVIGAVTAYVNFRDY